MVCVTWLIITSLIFSWGYVDFPFLKGQILGRKKTGDHLGEARNTSRIHRRVHLAYVLASRSGGVQNIQNSPSKKYLTDRVDHLQDW